MSKAHCSKITQPVLIRNRRVFAPIIGISLLGSSVFLQIVRSRNRSVCDHMAFPCFLQTEQCTAAKRLQSQQCNLPTHHGRPAADPALIIPLCLATILFVTRICAKYMRISGSWGWDDYSIIVAYVRLLPGLLHCNNTWFSNTR